MTPISNRTPPVAVEYDRRGKRVTKRFDDCFEARRFFTAKDRDGRNPKVRRIEMARKSREDGGEPVVESVEQQELTEAQREAFVRCNEVKQHLKAAAILYHELELEGQARRCRTEHDKMDERRDRIVKRIGRDGSREEREERKREKKAERIAKLKEQLARLVEEDE